jgi:hypothetical protein
MRRLLVNAIITPDGTHLESLHRHDYRSHVDDNGETYSVDGGSEYIRRSVNNIPATDACVYSDDGHSKIREAFKWGTYGRTGSDPFERKKLSELSDAHILAILDSQKQLSPEIKKVFYDELTYRKTIQNYDSH